MRFVFVALWCSLPWVGLGSAVAAETGASLDDFGDASRWEAVTSDGVTFNCKAERAADPNSAHPTTLRLDYDFASSGFAGIRRKLPLDLPPNFELAFSLRGDLPPNNLEFKLVDESGNNVWWVDRRGFKFPHQWTRLASRRRHFQFAWGPSSEPLRKAAAIEIVVSSAEGGRGTVWLDDLTFRPLPETKPYTGTPTATATSTVPGSAAKYAIDGDRNTEWRSDPNASKAELTIDFGQPREFGGLAIHWNPKSFAPSYEVSISEDGTSWQRLRSVAHNTGRAQFLSLPDAEARLVRLRMQAPSGPRQMAIREIEVLPLEASSDENRFAAEVASRFPRGRYPRATTGEGTFWTIVGTPTDEHEALVSEDGAAEVDKNAFSIEPFIWASGQLLTWADAKTSQSLAAGFAPVPTVTRQFNDLRLTVTAAAEGRPGRSSLLLLYTLTNTSKNRQDGALLVAVRPFQVNPPYQWLNTVGGVSHVERMALDATGRQLRVDGRVVALGDAPDAFGVAAYDEGDVTSFLADDQLPPHQELLDAERRASGALKYRFELGPAESRSWAVCVPFSQDPAVVQPLVKEIVSAPDAAEVVQRRQTAIVDKWRKTTDTFELLVPPEATDVVNTIRSTLAYILINQDGKAIHPGSRSYERSWIRDGSLTSAALLRFGLVEDARDFVDWYADYQFPSGKVPCVVDRRGADPVPENDSHGEFIMAVMNVYRFTGDKEFLRRHWPGVQKAVTYIEKLRGERMTPEFSDARSTATRQEPGKAAVSVRGFYGLMPESISHEGYSAEPMHSYWDDFFTLKGLKDAAEMARALDHQQAAAQYQQLADDFARTLYASIDLAMKTHGIDYIPGCVELGDFDATSTTIALWPCGELGRLPQPALVGTFDKYWKRFVQRRDDPQFNWVDYTPYELRTIGSFVLMDQPERAASAAILVERSAAAQLEPVAGSRASQSADSQIHRRYAAYLVRVGFCQLGTDDVSLRA